jgi:hypothetical protein
MRDIYRNSYHKSKWKKYLVVDWFSTHGVIPAKIVADKTSFWIRETHTKTHTIINKSIIYIK